MASNRTTHSLSTRSRVHPLHRFGSAVAAAALILVAPTWAPCVQAANLLTNASFENGPEPGVAVQLASGSTAVSGWVVTPSNVDYVGTRWTAAQGQRSMGLNGSSPGGISQSFATLPGAEYAVRFYMAGDSFTLPVIKTLRISAAGQSAVVQADITDMWPWDPGWNPHMFHFFANSTATTLKFESLDTGDAGPSIDSVTVGAVTPTDAFFGSGASLTLGAVHPNPLRGAVAQIEFATGREGEIRLAVYDVSGRAVATLVNEVRGPGRYQAAWDGRVGNEPAPAGVYFVVLRNDLESRVQRVVVMH